MHIAIAGNIGAGKTTLTRMLCSYYGWQPRFEAVIDNPYLEDYYSDIPRWSFCLETYFLKQRFKDVLDINRMSNVETLVQDRTIYEGVHVFVRYNYEHGNLSERDYRTYMDLFDLMTSLTRMPDLMIYLRKSLPILIKQIQLRGRAYEQTMQLEYLQGLNEIYDDFIFNKYQGRVLIIESDELDFEHNPQDFQKITNKIDAELFGLFSNQ